MNSASRFSLRLLSHPVTLLACAIWLLNNLLLKPLMPSFLTGKIGDVAGLFVLPFLTAFFLGLIAPVVHFTDTTLRRFSLALPAALFGAVKLFPDFTQFLNQKLAMRITPDLSDLLALPVLAASAWLWRTLEARPAPHRAWQWLALPLVMLTTMADLTPADYGISCLKYDNGMLYASNTIGQVFLSGDGGFTWQKETPSPIENCRGSAIFKLPQTLEDPARGVLYRFSARNQVEVSTDNGKSWSVEPLQGNISEPEGQYIRLTSSSGPIFEPGPIQVALEPKTGNLILSMGHEGVLVREPSGRYTWVAVGKYQHHTLARAGFNGYLTLLIQPFLLSILIAFLAMRTWALRRDSTTWQIVLTIFAWLLTLAFAIAIQPGFLAYPTLILTISLVVFIVVMVILLILNLVALKRMKPDSRWWKRLIPRALVIALISFLFYIAWTLEWIGSYSLAALLSAIWVLIAVFLQFSRIPRQSAE